MLYRKIATHVSLAYRYHNPRRDLNQNRATYGDDHSVEGIGANMTIWLESQPAMLEQAKRLLDHRCLFEVEPWFEARVPTLENIALFLCQKLAVERLVVEENAGWRVEVFDRRWQLTHAFRRGGWTLAATVEDDIDAETGLLIERNRFRAAIQDCQQNDTRAFFTALRSRLPQLIRLRADRPLPSNESYEIACVAR